MRNGSVALLLGMLAWAAPATAADNWPRFRGPNGAGVSADKNIPVRWTEQNILWKVELPGAGNSSPVVWGRRLFLESATGRDRLLLCIDTATGKVLWQRAMAGTTARKHPKNSFASSTPATDGERVYALFWDGRDVSLSAYDFDGKLVWRRDLGPFTSQHGPGASPVVYRGKVFLNNDQDGAAELVALDAQNGKVAWKAQRRAFRACYSTPFILNEGGRPELICASTAGITSYNPDDGAVYWDWRWSFSGMALRTVGSPVAGNGIIFAGSGDGSGERHMVAVKAGGKGDVTKTNLLWQKKRDFPYVPSMLVKGDYLFYVNDRGSASCREARTGKVLWSERLSGGPVSASPLLIDDKIYAIDEAGNVFVLQAEPTFKRLARNALGERVIATPAVADGRLFIRGAQHLYCIGKPK